MAVSSDMLRSISTPEKLGTRLGTFEFVSCLDKTWRPSEIEVVI